VVATAMSRPTKRTKTAEPAEPTGGTHILVWVVYGLGIFGAVVLAGAALFSYGASLGSDDVGLNVSPVAFIVWGGFVLLALVTYVVRRRKGHRR
jgi:hypothetical protein